VVDTCYPWILPQSIRSEPLVSLVTSAHNRCFNRTCTLTHAGCTNDGSNSDRATKCIYSPKRPERRCGQLPHSLFSGYRGLFLQGLSGRSVRLTTHLYLMPRSRMTAPFLQSLFIPSCLYLYHHTVVYRIPWIRKLDEHRLWRRCNVAKVWRIGGVEAKSTMGIRNFNLRSSQVRKLGKILSNQSLIYTRPCPPLSPQCK
jgi:hypothetical protein